MYINKIYHDFEWLDPHLEFPTTSSWDRSNEIPEVGQKRKALGRSGLTLNYEEWFLFQKGFSSINKSFEDFPDEFEDTCFVRVRILTSHQSKIPESESLLYYTRTLNTWYECEVIEVIHLIDAPQILSPCNIGGLPDYKENDYDIWAIESDSFFVVSSDSQGYAGSESLYLKHNGNIFLILHTEYFDEEYNTECYNYCLSPSEVKKIKNYTRQ